MQSNACICFILLQYSWLKHHHLPCNCHLSERSSCISCKGLLRSLKVVDVYCQKWQLSINSEKTKIIVFNKRSVDFSFSLGGKPLERIDSYNYLGIRISKSGSFIPAIKDLFDKALRAYHSIVSSFRNITMNPKIFMRLYDSLVKPISIYACEIWAAFGHKPNMVTDIISLLYENYKTPFEQLHLRCCKKALSVSRRTSNFGSLAELGRLPVIYNILIAVCKYRVRLNSMPEDSLLVHALNSQAQLSHNSNKTSTYSDFTANLFKQLKLKIPSCKQSDSQHCFDSAIKTSLIHKFKQHYHVLLNRLKNNSESKLQMYARLKGELSFEGYLLDNPAAHFITKFRLSDHNLPVERGRYLKPKLLREFRTCTLCHSGVGDECHVLFNCSHPDLRKLRRESLSMIQNISIQFSNLSPVERTYYLLNCVDRDLIYPTSCWIKHICVLFRQNSLWLDKEFRSESLS